MRLPRRIGITGREISPGKATETSAETDVQRNLEEMFAESFAFLNAYTKKQTAS